MKKLCIYCGSSAGKNPAYAQLAQAMGTQLAEAGYEIVYGGGSTGLMGIVADAALEAGGRVTGIIPRALYDKEVGHDRLSELYIVASMHERKTMMAALSDAFIALPGGYGTLEEYVEVLTWSQLGFHAKPCVLLNADGFYQGLLNFFDHLVDEGFVLPRLRQLVLTAGTIEELLHLLQNYEPIGTDKWLEKDDL